MTRFNKTTSRILVLASSVGIEGILSIALIFFATKRLGADAYGFYGIVVAYTGLVAAIAEGGAGVAFAERWGKNTTAARRRLLSTQLALTASISLLFSLLFYFIWSNRSYLIQDEIFINTPEAFFLTIFGLLLFRSLYTFARTALIIDGRSHNLAVANITYSSTVFLSTLFFIFVANAGHVSLPYGALTGFIVATSVCFFFLRRYLSFRLSGPYLKNAFRLLRTSTFAASTDGIRGIAESTFLVTFLSVAHVGVFGHARLYHSMMLKLAKSVGNVLWSRALLEARLPDSQFESIRRGWTAVHLGVTTAGIVFAMVGKDIVNILSNEQFTEAAQYIPPLFIALLIQLSGRPAIASIYALKGGPELLFVRSTLSILVILSIPASIYYFGILGLIIVFTMEQITFRAYIWFRATRLRPVPFQDRHAVTGIALIVAAMALSKATDMETMAQGAVALVLCVGALLPARSDMLHFARELREIVGISRSHGRTQ